MTTCQHCTTNFTILPEDKVFYQEMEVSEPTLCYTCRMQRRLSYRNERFLYHRKCDLTGKQIISSYSKDKPFPVYDNDAWWSDDWDPLTYGKDFDFSRPFFEQFYELRNTVPRLTLVQQEPMENSHYCNCASRNKNCYLVFSTNHCEDCYYGSWVNHSQDCVDNLNIWSCQQCYECSDCKDCYKLKYSENCMNSKNSAFLKNCNGCSNCFVCSNLNNKQYCIFNEQKTKEEYEAFMSELNMGSHQVIEEIKKRFDGLVNDLIVKEYIGTNIENSSGNYLNNCKNTHLSFECDDCEDIRYCMCLQHSKSSMDHSYWGVNTEKMYECHACGYDLYNLRFCNFCWTNCSNLTYCDHCTITKDCFGCVGLKNKQYCIFNKQYTKEEYEKLVPQIIEHMKQTGEWGEFFGIKNSIHGYNETLAQEQIPLTKEEVIANNWPWHEIEQELKNDYKGPKPEVADSIEVIDSSICDKILTCETSGKLYKIIPQELTFYKSQNIPIPRRCPDERHNLRLKERNPRLLWERKCEKCEKNIETSYAPESPEQVYCEECYLGEIY